MKKILLVILGCICYTSFIYGQHPPNKLGIEIKGFDRDSGTIEGNCHFSFLSISDLLKENSKLNEKQNYHSAEIPQIEKDNDYLYFSIYLSDFAGSGSLIQSAPLVDDKKIIVLQIVSNSTVMNVYLGFKKLMLEGRTAYINNFKFKEGNFFIEITDDHTSIIDDEIIDFSKSKKLSKAKIKAFTKQINCAGNI